MTTPIPMTPADCDLQSFPFMPLHVARLRDSDLAAECHPEACWYAVLLWSAAWHQVPAASLPDNETVLARLCNLGRDVKTFRKHRAEAMRGFVLCADGRWYHPVVAEQAVVAWESKRQQKYRTECARIKKANQRNGTSFENPTFEAFIDPCYLAPDAALSPSATPPSPAPVPRDAPLCPEGQGLQQTGIQTQKEEESFALPVSAEPKAAPGPSADDIREAFALWNALARRAGLPTARELTEDRRKRIASKLRAGGLDIWRSVLATIEASDFCRGGGERGWRIALDDLFQTKTWNKLRDGGYGAVVVPGADEIRPEVWARLVQNWRNGEPWPESAGPAPDQPGTRAPRELLTQHVAENANHHQRGVA